MEKAWERAKRSIVLGNSVRDGSQATQNAVFQRALDETVVDVVDRCRRQRKRKRAQETQRDLSDEAISRLASYTDGLPLADYDGLLELVPRLVNVRSPAHLVDQLELETMSLVRTSRLSPWQKQYRSREAASRCLWTCTASRRALPTATLPRGASPLCSWRSATRGVAF